MRFEMNRVRMRDACMYFWRLIMSRFHVEAVMKEFPELMGILGKKRIAKLDDAGVRRIHAPILLMKGYESPLYIISHDGLLLAKVEAAKGGEMFTWFFKKKENVLDAVRRCGADNVAYIAQCDPGCEGVDAPSALYIYKAPNNGGLAQLIKESTEKAEQEVKA